MTRLGIPPTTILSAAVLCVVVAAGCESGLNTDQSSKATATAATSDSILQPNAATDGATDGESKNSNTDAGAVSSEQRPVMVRIPAGTFFMGRGDLPTPQELLPYQNQIAMMQQSEQPRHEVHITHAFEISQYEITVQQFRHFVNSSGYITDAQRSGLGANGLDAAQDAVVQRPECVWLSPGFAQTEHHPVVCVSWQDTVAYCDWLSNRTGRTWRLPTEAEWEYCCRAGSDTLFASGNNSVSLQEFANCGDQALAAHCSLLTSAAKWNDGFAFTAPVGSFRPNAFGLYDLHGNVGEWCGDWFQSDFYEQSSGIDPTGPATPVQWRVVRGGSWYNMPFSCRSSGRHDGVPTAASTTNGFRVVRELPESR